MGKTCYVVVLNYNGWKDTVECLESLLKSDVENYHVIVVDNGSTNDSVARLEAWARGGLHAECEGNEKIRALVFPEIPKPVSIEIRRGGAEQQNACGGRLTLLALPENRGFAGGMNAGIRLALADEDCGYVWILNNDTVVTPDALRGTRDSFETEPRAGISESPMTDYYAPSAPEQGGAMVYAYDAHLGTARMVERDFHPTYCVPLYNGASFMVTRRFLETVGLMEERYFLYCEEPDWALRAGRAGFTVIRGAGLVYHKGGASTGGKGNVNRSYFADYYLIRSRILFTKKFFPHYLPLVYLALLGACVNRVRRKQWDRVAMILKLMWDPAPLLK